MGYLIATQNSVFPVLGIARGPWRTIGTSTASAPFVSSNNQQGWDPGQRMRNINASTGRFTRDWSGSGDGVLPMPFASGLVLLSLSPLLFPLSLPAISISQRVNLSPLVFPMALPDVEAASGDTLTPDPLVFPLGLPAVDFAAGGTVYPSPLTFPLVLPAVGVNRGAITLTPSPLVFPVILPAVAVNSAYEVSLDPLVFFVALPNLVTEPGPVSVSPDPLVLRVHLPRLKRGVGDPTPGRVLTHTLYQVILTGSADSTTDLLLACQSIQGTLRLDGKDRVAVYVPNAAAVLPGILARVHGTIIVWERLIYSDGTETIGEVIRAPITEPIRRDRGPTRDTLTLAGALVAEIPSGTTRTLSTAHQLYLEPGHHSWRVPYDVDIRPGDTVSYGGTFFRVGAIQINLGVTTREMQLQETE